MITLEAVAALPHGSKGQSERARQPHGGGGKTCGVAGHDQPQFCGTTFVCR